MADTGRLSVVVITRDAGRVLRPCLESARFADEVVVLDSGSRDDTLAIAREFTPHVHVDTDWQGFGRQKNRAVDLAGGDWILILDADERVGEALREEMRRVLADPAAPPVWEMPRHSSYCGRPIRHSGWRPDYVARLFRRGAARVSENRVHERLLFEGRPGRFRAPLLHDTHRSLEEVLDKINRYSSLGAEDYAARGRRGGLGRAIGHGLWAFLRTYCLRAGFLDGREGFILAVSTAEASYYRYLKLMYRQERGGRTE
jgi:glycosyltransferase involved in cell wall biosynthesis